jgi:hypothetical protein
MLLDIIAREMNHNDRWTAGGLSRIALILGFKQPKKDDESRIKRMLGPMLDQLKEDRMLDEHGPLAAQEMVDEIIDHLSKAIELSTQLLIDEGLPS